MHPAWPRCASQLGIPPSRLVVGYLGLLAEYQGTGDLIRAARLVVDAEPGTHFLIMGYPNAAEYEQAARQAGLAEHVTFTGRIPYAQAPTYLRLCDLAVAPKRSETEGNGKVLNYMAAGLANRGLCGRSGGRVSGSRGTAGRTRVGAGAGR